MTTYPERQKYITWIQRWSEGGKIHSDRRPMAQRPEPKSKLSVKEKESIIEICNETEYIDKNFIWKIDYYDKTLKVLSADKVDSNVTERVLTIWRSEEW